VEREGAGEGERVRGETVRVLLDFTGIARPGWASPIHTQPQQMKSLKKGMEKIYLKICKNKVKNQEGLGL
jgi:hypothetical protein